MDRTLAPGARRGSVRVPPSKSRMQRLLLCAALGEKTTLLRCGEVCGDVAAMIGCLRALGAGIGARPGGLLVTPLHAADVPAPDTVRELPCGESGAVLRFLLPVAGAMGVRAVFHRAGRLSERPIEPLAGQLRAHGMTVRESGAELYCEGKLLAGDYEIGGDVSSQFLSGLLFALPLLDVPSTLRVTGTLGSAPYVAMTEDALRLSHVPFEENGGLYRIPGGGRFSPPAELDAEGDWSAAAVFLCMGALSPSGICVTGLDLNSRQGDRAVLELLERFGAVTERGAESVTVRRGALRGCAVDASQTPDLVPVLAALAVCAGGETRIENAARLRCKESDRLASVSAMLGALGADVTETPDGLVIRGRGGLAGGIAEAAGDHRVAMAAAVAACGCRGSVTVRGAECVEKSFPSFWEELACLSM